ncbi:tRNA preQ1(34) S-adenosylmethionine ribosyltransferase-isomerase QueA [Candidatus Trichorickettsia mobilis]|uniref:tRNA preQ1(34) S-adenosylmethionine ribosyltransferase-isomerase QueA n=1 Tax=Candidatus Trichorickettsia mobilis TaxID=1346319 RepID=UPI002931E32A|nr:tRNA preQ1(34) S-adenosylmethionine ribosyltransferase-isomerase QueA [Candidatus Trichorickettsia mobilis]
MKLSDFDFHLPANIIAQYPTSKRDHSQLLVIPPDNKDFIKTEFYNLINYLLPGDVIVFNNSKVIKAKLILFKQDKKIICNLNKPIADNCWHGFVRPARKLCEGDEFKFDDHKVVISKKLAMGEVEIQFILNNISVFEFLEQYGHLPLPQYIKREAVDISDEHRYQTIYHHVPGSVAAPTAGLHFTDELLAQIKDKSIETAFVTLHVGAGTFLPVKTENILDHKMHAEYYHIDPITAQIINDAKAEKRRIIAVGTTTVRTLESSAKNGLIHGYGETDIFITPGFQFQIVDLLISNFHLPKSTLLMLVSAFAGYDKIRASYQYAINEKMRFFSYGDASLLYLNKSY